MFNDIVFLKILFFKIFFGDYLYGIMYNYLIDYYGLVNNKIECIFVVYIFSMCNILVNINVIDFYCLYLLLLL